MTTSKRVTFKTINASALAKQLNGPEQPHAAYDFANRTFYERPTRPGTTYRWVDADE